MKTTKLLFSVLLIASLIAGCKEDDKTNADLLIGHWMMTAMTATIPGFPVQDMYASMPGCEKDNHFIFEDGGSYISDEGSTKCSSSDPQQTTGNWSLSGDETVLTIFEGGDTTSLNIDELSEDVFKGSFTDSSSGGTMNVTLEKI